MNSCQAKNRFSREIIFSKILWFLIPPPDQSRINASLIHKLCEFYKLFYSYSHNFSKKDRHSLSLKCENLILDILELIFLALYIQNKFNKIKVLNKISNNLNTLKIFIRLLKEIKALDFKKYLLLQQKIDEIGKMLGGWIKSINESLNQTS